MAPLRSLLMFSSPIVGIALIAGTSQAIPLPDSGSCNSATGCLSITNTNPLGSTHDAIFGFDGVGNGIRGRSNTGVGVLGDSTNIGVLGATGAGTGVLGQSQSFVGVMGSSDTNNGVRGSTDSTTAAAISAISPNSSGLAYWGTGGIIITGSVAQKSGGGSWSAFSDSRIKKDVKALHWGLDELEKVRPVTFRYNGLGGSDNDGREYVGVLAQELEQILPSMVTLKKGKLRESDSEETDIRVVDPSAFTYVLINAVKEQQELIERQEKRIAALERPRASLSASLVGGGLGVGLVGLFTLAVAKLRAARVPRRARANT